MNTNHTIAKIEHSDSVTISIVPKDDGRWFRVLNRLIDAGYWAILPDTSRNVLIVLARHRGEDGVSKASILALCEGSRLSKGTVYKALAHLQHHTPPLLAKHGPDSWELFPGWTFASRKPESPPGDSSLHTEKKVSGGRISPSHSPSAQKDQGEEQQQQREPERENAAAAVGIAVEEGRKAGIDGAFVVALVQQHGLRVVYNAIVEARTRKGVPIENPASWVRSACVRRYDIADHLAQREAVESRRARMFGAAADQLRAAVQEWPEHERNRLIPDDQAFSAMLAWLASEPFGLRWQSLTAATLLSRIIAATTPSQTHTHPGAHAARAGGRA